MTVKWRGIPVELLADAPWPARDQLLQLLAVECVEAAVRDRAIKQARALRAPAATAAELRERWAVWGVIGPTDLDARRERWRTRRAADRAAARARAA